MDVLFSIIPGHGHFFPCIPLATALQRDGHRVRFASAASYGDTIRSHGFEAVPAGLDYTQVAARGDTDDRREIDRRVATRMFVDGPPVMLESLRGVVADRRPDVILADPVEDGSQVFAEAEQIPWGTVVGGLRTGLFPGRLPFDRDERQGRVERGNHGIVARMRAAVGLEESALLPSEMPYDRTLALCMGPPSLEAWPLSWISHTSHPLRPEPHRTAPDVSPLPSLPHDRPVVAISFGTLFGSTSQETHVVEGALAAGVTTVHVSPFDTGIGDERLVHVPWASIDELLRSCDALIHHGGFGSTVAALWRGLPAVVVPLGAEQPVQAERLSRVGAATVVDPDDRDPATIREAVELVLEDPLYALSARRLRDEIEAMPSAAEAVTLVEELARSGGPVLNRT